MTGIKRFKVATDEGVFHGTLIERRRCAGGTDPNTEEDDFMAEGRVGVCCAAAVVLIAAVVALWLAYGFLTS